VLAATARAARDVLARLDAALGDPPYNLVVHTAPPGSGPYHWYVEIMPRLSVVAGFEQATGLLVNSVPPERAAAELRDVAR
jgi:UDPglucose--hexose-1-phosphate uridylyltransferase